MQPGDFFRDDFPQGADTIVMMRITHDWSQGQVETLLRKALVTLPPGGHLLIYETFRDQGPDPGEAALISLLLLLISPGGECRTATEMEMLLKKTGFSDVELIPTIYLYSLMVAKNP